ncbi:MAG: DUF4363 family protein [Oscillospiraceae bacterium]|nr:DUF4363 family protein [Oscillospiraceae bacterium]
MKALYIPTALLIAIMVFSLWVGRYVEQRTDDWISLLEQVEETAAGENWTEAGERLRAAYEDWDANQEFFHTILEHDELDEAESLFAGALAVCEQEDDGEFHVLLAQLTKQMHVLAETQSVSVKNIL